MTFLHLRIGAKSLGASVVRWVPALVWMGFIFYLSSLPEIPGPKAITEHSRLGHFLMYAVLGILLRRAMPALHPAVSIISGLFYGLSDEFHQHFVPPRTAGLDDLAVDLVGVICGVVLLSHVRRQD